MFFSHFRIYDIDGGIDYFYVVTQRLVETDGTGFISAYGTLTVEFFLKR